jgi:hypothetical protein
MPALPASAFAAVVEDELVVRRADDLEAAHLQQKARAAARRRDWRPAASRWRATKLLRRRICAGNRVRVRRIGSRRGADSGAQGE